MRWGVARSYLPLARRRLPQHGDFVAQRQAVVHGGAVLVARAAHGVRAALLPRPAQALLLRRCLGRLQLRREHAHAREERGAPVLDQPRALGAHLPQRKEKGAAG